MGETMMDPLEGLRVEPGEVVAPKSSARPPTEDHALILAGILTALRELATINREQLELARRTEDRYQKQMQSQREEFSRWLDENNLTHGGCKQAEEILRTLLGSSLRNLVDHIDDQAESLVDAEFARTELLDRFGSTIAQLSTLYGVVKRLNVVDRSQVHTEG